MTPTAPQIRSKLPTEALVATIGFAIRLGDSGAVLTGTPTITVSPSGPTIGTVSKNAGTITVDGQQHVANTAAQALVEGGTSGSRYTLTCTAVTDDGQTLVETCDFDVM